MVHFKLVHWIKKKSSCQDKILGICALNLPDDCFVIVFFVVVSFS